MIFINKWLVQSLRLIFLSSLLHLNKLLPQDFHVIHESLDLKVLSFAFLLKITNLVQKFLFVFLKAIDLDSGVGSLRKLFLIVDLECVKVSFEYFLLLLQLPVLWPKLLLQLAVVFVFLVEFNLQLRNLVQFYLQILAHLLQFSIELLSFLVFFQFNLKHLRVFLRQVRVELLGQLCHFVLLVS